MMKCSAESISDLFIRSSSKEVSRALFVALTKASDDAEDLKTELELAASRAIGDEDFVQQNQARTYTIRVQAELQTRQMELEDQLRMKVARATSRSRSKQAESDAFTMCKVQKLLPLFNKTRITED